MRPGYDFEPLFRELADRNWYGDDDLLKRLLRRHARAVEQVRGSAPGRVVHGAQFVTEIQGGSDVPARLRGDAGAGGASGEMVDARREVVDRNPISRNGHTVDRLKEKIGTRELATAEVTFRGARAWPVGPPDRGLPVLLRHVLAPSRYGCVPGIWSRASRSARWRRPTDAPAERRIASPFDRAGSRASDRAAGRPGEPA